MSVCPLRSFLSLYPFSRSLYRNRLTTPHGASREGDRAQLQRVRGDGHLGDGVAFLLNPDFYETQPQKPHNKLKKAQMTLREKRLRPELKLGGESDNPTSKGIP